MKTKAKMMIAGLATLLSGAIYAQTDTVKTYVTPDTVKVIERTVVHDTVVRDERYNSKEEEPLRRGEFGLRFMPTFTQLSFTSYNGEVVQASSDLNYGYGVMFGLNLSKNFGLQAEVNYLDVLQRYKDRELERQVHVNYLNIPLLISLNTDKRKPVNFNVVVGPQFGINVGSSMSADENSNTTTVQATVGASGGDVGIAYGAGLEFALNRRHTVRLDLGFRGMYGLVDIDGGQTGPNSYNVLVNASRRSYGAYGGLTFCW